MKIKYIDHVEVVKDEMGVKIYFFQPFWRYDGDKKLYEDKIVGAFGMSNGYFNKMMKKLSKENAKTK